MNKLKVLIGGLYVRLLGLSTDYWVNSLFSSSMKFLLSFKYFSVFCGKLTWIHLGMPTEAHSNAFCLGAMVKCSVSRMYYNIFYQRDARDCFAVQQCQGLFCTSAMMSQFINSRRTTEQATMILCIITNLINVLCAIILSVSASLYFLFLCWVLQLFPTFLL